MKRRPLNVKVGKRVSLVMSISRGDIWVVSLDPTVGAEIRKTRPVVVVSSDAIGVLPIRLVAPLTEWKDRFAQNIWHVKLEPDSDNGLTKTSAVDTQRFVRKLGHVSPATMDSIVAAVAAVIEY